MAAEFSDRSIPHSLDAIRVAQSLANSFIEVARRSSHTCALAQLFSAQHLLTADCMGCWSGPSALPECMLHASACCVSAMSPSRKR